MPPNQPNWYVAASPEHPPLHPITLPVRDHFEQGSWREYANHRIRAASLRDRATTTTALDDLLSREDRLPSRRAAGSLLSRMNPRPTRVDRTGSRGCRQRQLSQNLCVSTTTIQIVIALSEGDLSCNVPMRFLSTLHLHEEKALAFLPRKPLTNHPDGWI